MVPCGVPIPGESQPTPFSHAPPTPSHICLSLLSTYSQHILSLSHTCMQPPATFLHPHDPHLHFMPVLSPLAPHFTFLGLFTKAVRSVNFPMAYQKGGSPLAWHSKFGIIQGLEPGYPCHSWTYQQLQVKVLPSHGNL